MPKTKYPYQEFSLKNLKGEIWEDLPDLDGAYEISNFGRVKSKRRFAHRAYREGYWVKEKILKQHRGLQVVSEGERKLYRLSATISFEGRKYNYGIARMVYYLFVEQFDLEDRKIRVSTKDEDPFHIRPGNLFLTSADVYMKKAYRLERRKRESFGNRGRAISQYSLRGKWLRSFPSISSAARSFNISSGHILESLNNNEGYANGYIWRYGNQKPDLSKIPKRVSLKIASEKFHARPVSCYDMKGIKIKEYKNLKAAAKSLRIQPDQIRRVIIGRTLTASGRYWKLGSGPDQISMSRLLKRIKDAGRSVRRPVTQYALDGRRIKSYESIMEAARKTAIHNMNISGALRSQAQRTAGGFLWQYGTGPAKIKIDATIRRKNELQELYDHPVTQYSLAGKRIAIYRSLLDAAKKMNIAPSFLADTVKGKALSYAGFYWQLSKGPAVIKANALADAERKRLIKISKPVIQYDLSAKKIRAYESISEAARATKITARQIRLAALGKFQAVRGYRWRFKKK